MNDVILLTTVLVVFGCAVLLVLLTLLTRVLAMRRRARFLELEPRCREQVEQLILSGARPRVTGAAERRLMLDLLLRHLSLLRGREARLIIGHLEEAGYVEDLAEGLSHGRPWQRAAAADLLGRSRSTRAVQPLTAALSDHDEDVRLVAARSLALIGTPDAVDALAGALVAPTRWALAMVADNLVLLGGAAVPALLSMMRRDDDPKAVAAAARILGEVRDPRATGALLDAARLSADVDARAQAVAALGKIGGADAVRTLLSALRDPAWEVRAQAAKGLGRLGDQTAAPALQRAMPDPSWWVRVNCGEALAQLGEPGRLALREVAGGDDRYAAEQARAVLTRLATVAARTAGEAAARARHHDAPLATVGSAGGIRVPAACGAAATAPRPAARLVGMEQP